MGTRFSVILGMFLPVALLAQTLPAAQPIPQFEDITKRTGLTVPHNSTPEKRYIVESMSGGVGFIDCDNDGKLDILTINGSSVDRYRKGGDPMITLYHQDADLKFTDITQAAGLTRKGWGMGVSVMDFDNDGWQDIYVTGYGGNALYRNLGNCKFEDVTDKAGLRVGGFSTGAAWADYDRDGFVDLFVPRYVHVDMNNLPEFGSDDKFCRYRGVMVQCGPGGLPGESDFLFRNRGDGTFEDIGLLSGTALSLDGKEQGSMGVDFGDFDHDGRLDIFVTNFVNEPDALYWNQGEQGFTDIGWKAGIAKATTPLVGWGTGFVDFVNDGWLDIFEVNGHVYPQMDYIKGAAGYKQPVLLYRNNRDRTFEDITALSGLDKLPPASRRGAAFGDLNNDGKIDILMLNVGQPPTLLLNRTRTSNHAVLFKLIGTKSNKAAIGARVSVTAGGVVQFTEVRSGTSYLSQNDLRLHFGLGKETTMDTVEVSWPSGKKEIYKDLASDFIYTITEGTGVQQKTPFEVGDKP